jgi:hypothetical protein
MVKGTPALVRILAQAKPERPAPMMTILGEGEGMMWGAMKNGCLKAECKLDGCQG